MSSDFKRPVWKHTLYYKIFNEGLVKTISGPPEWNYNIEFYEWEIERIWRENRTSQRQTG